MTNCQEYKPSKNVKSNIILRLDYKYGTWLLIDGDGLKHSTNGTWLYLEHPYLVHDQLIFKAGNVLLKVTHANILTQEQKLRTAI